MNKEWALVFCSAFLKSPTLYIPRWCAKPTLISSAEPAKRPWNETLRVRRSRNEMKACGRSCQFPIPPNGYPSIWNFYTNKCAILLHCGSTVPVPGFEFHSKLLLNPECLVFWGLGLDTSEISTTLDTQTYEKEGLLNLFQTFQGRKPTSHSNCDPWSILCCLGLAQAFVIMIGHQYRACSSVLVDLLPAPMTHR